MNRTVRFALAMGGFLVIPVALLTLHHAFTTGALKRFKAELRAEGEKLTFVELAISPSTNLEEVACRNTFVSNTFTFEGNVPVLMNFVEPGKARVAWQGGLRVSPSAGRTNASAGNWEEFDRQNDAVAGALSEFRRVLEHPAPDTGWIYGNNLDSPRVNWVRIRNVAQALTSAEIGELHRGDFEAAHADLRALAALARVNRNDPRLVSSMIRVAISDLGLRGTWEALSAPGWDEAGLSELQRDWEQLDLVGALERGFLGERAFGSALMAKVRNSNDQEFRAIMGVMPLSSAAGEKFPLTYRLRDHVVRMAYKLVSMDEDELFMLRTEQRAVETARLLNANRPWPEVRLVVSNHVAELERELNSTYGRRLMASRIAIPNFSRTYEKTMQAEMLRRLTIAAIAIQRFQLRYGKRPANLAALRPEFVAEIPIDPMSGKPLCYRLNSDGTFVLYSVGEDGKDDGGTAGMDLWSGPDVVWPVTAGN